MELAFGILVEIVVTAADPIPVVVGKHVVEREEPERLIDIEQRIEGGGQPIRGGLIQSLAEKDQTNP